MADAVFQRVEITAAHPDSAFTVFADAMDSFVKPRRGLIDSLKELIPIGEKTAVCSDPNRTRAINQNAADEPIG